MQAVRVRIREVVAHPSSFEKGSQIAEFTAPRFDLGGLVEISPSPTLRLQAPLKGLFRAKQTLVANLLQERSRPGTGTSRSGCCLFRPVVHGSGRYPPLPPADKVVFG